MKAESSDTRRKSAGSLAQHNCDIHIVALGKQVSILCQSERRPSAGPAIVLSSCERLMPGSGRVDGCLSSLG